MIYVIVGIIFCMMIGGCLSILGMATDDDDTFKIIERAAIVSYIIMLILNVIGFVILGMRY